VTDPAVVEEMVLRSLPLLVVIDADALVSGLALCTRLKSDSYSAIVPLAAVADRHTTAVVEGWFKAGADEVITPLFELGEQTSRLNGLLDRTARDVAVNPSTRLPGTTEIDREIRRRMDRGEKFAVCYADLDHFKEFNDRYSYYDGDRVINLSHPARCGRDGGVRDSGAHRRRRFYVIIPLASISPCAARSSTC
jgi:PleD family two-component response regulator